MNLSALPHLTVETADNPDAAVIWLHGLGADGHDFEPIVPQLGLKAEARIRFIFPHAPAMPVTLNGGYVMPAWYDIRQSDLGIEHDERSIIASARAIRLLIEQQQMQGLPASRIALAGFSQGAAMALYVGLAEQERHAGILALSGYMLLPQQLQDRLSKAARSTPVFMAHGVNDPVVPFDLGEMACKRLQGLGITVEWHSYPMAHQVCPAEITDIGDWLNRIL